MTGDPGIHLVRTDENVAEIDALAGLLGGRIGLEGLLPRMAHRARRSLLGRLLGRAVDEAYRWERPDGRDTRWWPQGVSSSADADDSGTVAGRPLVVTTWYARDLGGGSHGSRVTFLDLASLRYQHVLLVSATLDAAGDPVLSPLRIHAGGIVWRGRHLHVAATARGLVSFRVDDIMRVDGEVPDLLGLADGRVSAFGHAYLLPVRFTYRARPATGRERLRYSFLSLDRSTSPPGLLAGEYGRAGASTRLAAFELTASGLPVTGEDGTTRPTSLEDGGVSHAQGAVTARGRLHLTTSHGPWRPGTVHVGRPGAFRAHPLAVPMGPEDVTYWPATDRLWSLSEHPHRRWVFSMRRARFDT